MFWTMFVAMVVAKFVGDTIWHFMQLWMMNTNWYQSYMSRLSLKLTKRVIKEYEDEEV